MTARHDETAVRVCTSLQGEVNASYRTLVDCFGEPGEGDGYKSAFEWRLRFDDGTVATIYDWKSTDLYEPGLGAPDSLKHYESFCWHIGGTSKAAVERVREQLARHASTAARKPATDAENDFTIRMRRAVEQFRAALSTLNAAQAVFDECSEKLDALVRESQATRAARTLPVVDAQAAARAMFDLSADEPVPSILRPQAGDV